MQTYTYYNASLFGQRIPGGTLLASGDSVVVTRPSAELDVAWDALHYRAALTGLVAVGAADATLLAASALSPTPTYARHTGVGTIATTSRSIVAISSTASGVYTLTLPDASTYGAQTLHAFVHHESSANNLTIAPNGTDTIEGAATLTRSGVVFAALSGIPSTVTVALVANVTTANGIHSIVEVPGVSTIINADFASGLVTAAMIVAAITAGTAVTTPFTGSVNVSASTAAPATVVAAAVAAALVPSTVALTIAANTLRFVSDGVSNWTTY